MKNQNQQEHQYHQINWVASYPKSGNTWLRLFLDAYFLGKAELKQILVTPADDRAPMYHPGVGKLPANHYPLDIQHTLRPAALFKYVHTYLDQKASAQAKGSDVPQMFVKTHTVNMHVNGVDLIPMALSKSAVYIIRDPRDVLPSFAKHMGHDGDIAQAWTWMQQENRVLTGPTGMMDLISSWGNNVRYWTNDRTKNIMVVRYEDIRKNPIEWFTKILEHYGEDVDPFKVANAVELTDIRTLAEKERDEGFGESSPHAKNQFFSGGGRVGNWRDKGVTREIEKQIKRKYGKLMREFNYL